jgi:catechol 2,3-dioxygenase-like lactoylglutathione lyase family enzyme
MNKILSGVHHIAVNVSDIDKSIRFYEKILGFKLLFSPQEGSGEELEKAVKVPAAQLKYAMLQTENVVVELIQYLNPIGKPYDRSNCDTGNMHLAFRVSDIDDAYAKLKERGVTFNGPPVKIDSGPLSKCAFAYFTDPDGVTLEIFQE